MRVKYITSAVLIAASFVVFTSAVPTDNTGKKPKAILVQLSSEKNRLTAMKRDNKIDFLEEVTIDAQKVIEVTKMDFKDHFNYCPVYYFMDTNAEAVINKNFSGVLQNEDGSSATDLPINNNSTNKDYYIVFYGYPNVQDWRDTVAKDELSSFPGRGLIILNDRYKQLARTTDPGYISVNYKNNAYAYFSKRFDIQYIPYAGILNTKLYGGAADVRGRSLKRR